MARIAIADDSSFMRSTLKAIVAGAGHEVAGTATEGQEAVELYAKVKPDAALLDILMTGLDGLGALKAIKEIDPGAKVIMVSAYGQKERQEEALKLGASGYLRKPFKREEVVAEIDRVLSGTV